jgi:DNA polymerase-3 subunit delta
MIIFLYGPDTYRSSQKLKELTEGYKKIHKSGLNLRVLDVGSLNFQDFEDEIRQTSMFKEKKLTVLTSIFSNPEFGKEFSKKGKAFVKSENIVIFYEEGEAKKKNSLFTFLKKHSKFQEFNKLEGQRLKKWTEKEFQKLGAQIEDGALNKLVVFAGDSLWRMANEIRKLVSFKDGKEISVRDVELLVRPDIDSDIFRTIDAIASRDKKRALKLLKDHLNKGDSPFYLFSMINFQFRNLLIVKDLIINNLSPFHLAKLHPFVVKKSSALSRKFEMSELKKIYQEIFKIDLNVKTGKIEPEVALDLLITEI